MRNPLENLSSDEALEALRAKLNGTPLPKKETYVCNDCLMPELAQDQQTRKVRALFVGEKDTPFCVKCHATSTFVVSDPLPR